MMLRFSQLLLLLLPLSSAALDICPGESDRYYDFKCQHGSTHRICAQLVSDEKTCSPLPWGDNDDLNDNALKLKDFWQLTSPASSTSSASVANDLSSLQRKQMCNSPNSGVHQCIDLWTFSRIIDTVGCDVAVGKHVKCESTDVDFVIARWRDGGKRMEKAIECLEEYCSKKKQKVEKKKSNATKTDSTSEPNISNNEEL